MTVPRAGCGSLAAAFSPAAEIGSPAVVSEAAPGRLRVAPLSAVLVSLALAVTVAGPMLPTTGFAGPPLPLPVRLGIAVAVFAVGQLARLRLRIESGVVNLGWGEAALIVGLYLVPVGWLPAATLVGAGLAVLLLSAAVQRQPPADVAHAVASVTLAATLGAVVTRAVENPYGAALTPRLGLAYALGATTYLLVTVGLVALSLSLRHGLRPRAVLLATLRAKMLMAVGNVLIGLHVVALAGTDPIWLLLLPLAMCVLQQAYLQRLRTVEERRVWNCLAHATRSLLHQLDERSVAVAGVRGALQLCGAERAAVDVLSAEGRRRRYRSDGVSVVVEAEATGPPAAVDPSGSVVLRPLRVGGTDVGELRLYYPAVTAAPDRDQVALAAFGDALAAALHDAATHRNLRLIQARSSYDAVHDLLTGLLNRSALLGQGDARLRALRPDVPVFLMLLDINEFKEVNDTLGHAAGDGLLRVIASRLSNLRRPDELLARLGGDEFALLLPSAPDDDEPSLVDRPAPMAAALRRARQLAEQLALPTEVAGVRLCVEASVGVVMAPAGTADMTELLRRADIAMYQAKAGGGNVAWYDSARDAGSTDQLALLAELRTALTVDDQLVLALQPAVDLTTGEPTGVEALIRWHHPRRGALGPGEFVRTIEGSELLSAFTRYVVDKALAAAADWSRQGVQVPISVNVSARSLLDPRLPADIAELLRRHRVRPDRLVLEITETAVMSELEVIDEVLAGLRATGVQLAVDDFGTGYSSLTFLTRISVDELKVDREFVARMVDSPEAAAIVRTTVELGRELGLRVVAEGVETAGQRAALAALGCTAAQGYHFFRPMPADKVVTVLRSLLDEAHATVYPLRIDGVS